MAVPLCKVSTKAATTNVNDIDSRTQLLELLLVVVVALVCVQQLLQRCSCICFVSLSVSLCLCVCLHPSLGCLFILANICFDWRKGVRRNMH